MYFFFSCFDNTSKIFILTKKTYFFMQQFCVVTIRYLFAYQHVRKQKKMKWRTVYVELNYAPKHKEWTYVHFHKMLTSILSQKMPSSKPILHIYNNQILLQTGATRRWKTFYGGKMKNMWLDSVYYSYILLQSLCFFIVHLCG